MPDAVLVASGLLAGPFPGGWVTYRSRCMVDCVARNAVPRSSADRPYALALRGVIGCVMHALGVALAHWERDP
jgi:hypothetical protein